jgi:hypothetical protein
MGNEEGAASSIEPRQGHRLSIALMLIHVLVTAVVVSLAWAQIERRFHREVVPFFGSYVVFSLLYVLATARFHSSCTRLAVVATGLPYVAATCAFVAISIHRAVMKGEMMSAVLISLFAPYAVIWGPLISIFNAMLVLLATWLMARHSN